MPLLQEVEEAISMLLEGGVWDEAMRIVMMTTKHMLTLSIPRALSSLL